MWKKFLAICTVMILIVALVACSQSQNGTQPPQEGENNEGQQPSGDTGNAASDGPFGKYDPAIEVWTVFQKTDSNLSLDEGETIENNRYTQRYEQDLGIRIKYKWTAPSTQAKDKINIMLTSGDIPDMLSVDRETFEKLYSADLIEDLTPYIDKYASPYTKKYLSGEYQHALDVTTKEGKVYGIPNGVSYHEHAPMLWIRLDWLKNVGMDLPKTGDDLLKIMDAFVNNDPDKNNKKDTYAIGTYKSTPGEWMNDAFWNMFNSYPNIWIEGKDGKLQDGRFGNDYKSNTKNALLTLQGWYKKGYVNPDFMTMNYDQYQEDVLNNKCGIVFGAEWDAYGPPLLTQVQEDPTIDWAPVPIVSLGQQPAKASTSVFNCWNINVVRKGYEHPEALIKMCNLYHKLNNDPETMEFAKYNTDPVTSAAYMDLYPLQVYNPSFNYEASLAIDKALETNDPSGLCEAYKLFYDRIKAYLDNHDVTGWCDYRSYTKDGSMGVCDYYLKNKMLMFNEYTAPPTQTMIEKLPVIKKLYDETVAKVVMGENISLFDKFIDDYRKLGGEQMETEVNQWYESNGKKSINQDLNK
ncbi:extracellular solute-binding protein [Mahella australiensis]|uniref:Extracellular solute-binding protein family 1 n=1 Tax=Mahella australiensis (strain DSM 15567 / CIP 107919 / 50-1 BON) TaxID=697281 RepID=F3ZZP8_MAHA5|nr:extracellular solute-binding protein [Mahella australiensis]AEE97895.1 extracellular solute-binding protein family 1 [Mahella australiensis 50-1 BON]